MDAGDRAQIDDVVAEVTRTLGRVQILVNNAAVNVIGSIFDYDPEHWDWCVRVNLSGPWYLCRAVMPLMRDAGSGVIVNVSSYAPDVGGGGIEAPYAITKGGLNVLTRSCAHEGGPFGIRAVTVATGIVTGTKFIDDHPEMLDSPGARGHWGPSPTPTASPKPSPSSRPTVPATSPARSSTSPPARTCGTEDRRACTRSGSRPPCPRPTRPLADWHAQLRHLEDLGLSSVVAADHFTGGYTFEPMVALTAAAAATTRLRLQTGVLGNDYRHPVLVHRMAALLDVVSDGRLVLGLGAGWMTSDYEAAGIALDPAGVRVSRFAEALAVIKGLFGPEPFDFAGEHYSVHALDGLPKPVQHPHPPLFVGGGSPRVLRLAGRRGRRRRDQRQPARRGAGCARGA